MSRAWAFAAVFLTSVAGGCARTVVYRLGGGKDDRAPARIDVRADARHGFVLEVSELDGPTSAETVLCSAPLYSIEEAAQLIEVAPGTYGLLVKAERLSPPLAFPLRGEGVLEEGRCYRPAMDCDGPSIDADACHLQLEPVTCGVRWLPRRMQAHGVRAC